ncbi:hypothetical protein [Micromonospora okii]|uniref:hypothetical protein n=1 Tax=Micromonospora okii TaxID=1182970 RepID=UPI001E629D9D|nr:hypothetical protein [Micromonospora okii]
MAVLMQSGMRITPARLNGSYYQDVLTGLVVPSAFTLLDFLARLRPSSGTCSVWLYVRSESNIAAGSGGIAPNIVDTLCATLPVGTRPPAITGGLAWGSGTNHGEGLINPDGTVLLRSTTIAIPAQSNIRMFATYSL